MKTPEKTLQTAAVKWWKMHRPLSYTHKTHLLNPTVNCATPSEARLAQAVANYLSQP